MQLSFVLVNPARATNVGAAARAIKTMGFNRLILVGSDLQYDTAARYTAHGAQEILENCCSVASLQELKPNYDLLIATTARERSSSRHYLSPQQLAAQLETQSGSCALVFGCEASGLSNEQLALCDLYSYIPLAQPYPSLNLGQAVMVYAYALSQLCHSMGLQPREADATQLQVLKQRTSTFLDQYDADKSQKIREWLQERLSQLSDRDVRMAHQLLGMLENLK